MARFGGAAAATATGDPRGQGCPPSSAYTPGGCQWGSELDKSRRGEANPRAISPSIPSAQGPSEAHASPWPCQSGSRTPCQPHGNSFHGGGRQECKLIVLAAELSGLCGKILARLDQGKCATGKLPSGILPCPIQLGSHLCSWPGTWAFSTWPGLPQPGQGLPHSHHGGTVYLFCPAHPQQDTVQEHFPLLSLALYFLVPILFIGQGEG